MRLDVLVIGGGQAGLAAGYFLRRTALSFEIWDEGETPGGAWPRAWDSLTLFSPAAHSSLPGWPMPAPADGGYPPRDAVVEYLAAYEARYSLPVRRPRRVTAVRAGTDALVVEADGITAEARHVISATGTWAAPHIPDVPGRALFRGVQMHSAQYRRPDTFAGQSVLVVGGGNSGAQILAEVSRHAARCTWVTEREPVFLPDDVDGRVLFERATARWQAEREGKPPPQQLGGLGNIVAVPPVREARARGVLVSRPPFARLDAHSAIWADGARIPADAILWCTGFRPALSHLAPLGVVEADGLVRVDEDGRSLREARLWLLGYGDWTGMASATLAGVTRAARAVARGIAG
ncbi:ArsO family NAD(P)H-dependent flavin-containing monooxygenase [Roseococcus suduntuyensis]|uniref:Pyruvate/2-oxoglutarate dehydrogenase complex dihydrolipoamide dehydrogenase (E3) component n=1 Tax=Roseococcus suduntuyensis TaxID=455361 RepID=A0A840AA15_9PROT|nr:ArsO family NAD(P)H-dependent flavin-containing monooxygenase [Roseococcus suduntuyensis]MBB3897025.1 pyruvate/2-oxoglutarate dehydrogenase complex dihydrolipoamide dehydrogenase (E3) component [Roseococcus suduntuyensis]